MGKELLLPSSLSSDRLILFSNNTRLYNPLLQLSHLRI
jgi:hypothetical protein